MRKLLPNIKSRCHNLGCLIITIALSACATTPEPVVEVAPEPIRVEDLAVEIFAPEPVPEVVSVPSIDIEEYERQLAEEAEALRAAEEALNPAPAPVAPVIKPVIPQTLEERLAKASTPDKKISILQEESSSDSVDTMLIAAYQDKLTADRASGDSSGAADALVFLGQVDAKGGAREENLAALSKFAEALELDPENAEAPRLVSTTRGQLQGYADTLHKEAVSHFVKQDFATAVTLWEEVLLIDPGNAAARNWFTQAEQAIGR